MLQTILDMLAAAKTIDDVATADQHFLDAVCYNKLDEAEQTIATEALTAAYNRVP